MNSWQQYQPFWLKAYGQETTLHWEHISIHWTSTYFSFHCLLTTVVGFWTRCAELLVSMKFSMSSVNVKSKLLSVSIYPELLFSAVPCCCLPELIHHNFSNTKHFTFSLESVKLSSVYCISCLSKHCAVPVHWKRTFSVIIYFALQYSSFPSYWPHFECAQSLKLHKVLQCHQLCKC